MNPIVPIAQEQEMKYDERQNNRLNTIHDRSKIEIHKSWLKNSRSERRW